MFPPLCLPAAQKRDAVTLNAILTAGQLRLVESNPKYEIRFKIVELWESLLELFRA
jgi:stage II sporulation protein R